MAPQGVVRDIQLIVAHVGGSAAGNEQQLISDVRGRLNTKYVDFDLPSTQIRVLLHGSRWCSSFEKAVTSSTSQRGATSVEEPGGLMASI